jgi:hypothetical protein
MSRVCVNYFGIFLVCGALFAYFTKLCVDGTRETVMRCPEETQKCPDYVDPAVEVIRYHGPCKDLTNPNSSCDVLGCSWNDCERCPILWIRQYI